MEETRFRGNDVSDEARDVLGFADTGDPHLADHGRFGVCRVDSFFACESLQAALQAVGAHGAGIDRVDLHAVLNAQFRQRLAQRKQRRIHRPSNGELRAGRSSADSGDIDQRTPPFLELRPCGAAQAHRAEEFEGVAVVPVFFREGQKVAALCGASVVDHDIDAAEMRLRKLREVARSIRFA